MPTCSRGPGTQEAATRGRHAAIRGAAHGLRRVQSSISLSLMRTHDVTQAPAYAASTAATTSPLHLAARHIDQSLNGSTQVSCLKRRGRKRRCALKATWSELLHGKNCTHATNLDVLPDFGGPRRKPIVMHIDIPLPVYHSVVPTAVMYNDTFWMGLDPSTQPSPTTLWYVPGMTMILSDHVDLALAIRQPARMGTWPGVRRMMRWAAANLTNIDTVLFTHHFDANDATCRDHLHGCCHLVAELVALHDWRPMSCPGHPRLREGVVPRRCSCTVSQSIGWGRERDSNLHYRTLSAEEARAYVC